MAEPVEILGLDGLLYSLRELPKAVQGKAAQAGMRKGGNIIRDEARKRAPRASGFLAKQIVVRRVNAKNRRGAGVGADGEYYTVGIRTGKRIKYANTKRNRRMRRAGKLYEQSGWAYYWRHIEFGTKKMAANPFLTPAAEAKGPQAAQVIIDETWAGIDKLMKARGWK
ncbi:HK97-gp10 family putative phage morphogenesis protein [Stenotrophomonas rhizophila]|uniref:HK97-gp10 family putative phage morphogenesis protein n=1 Tax=Stenotrophomonas rhizophila TaxID=216778 RepID=UPI0028ADD62E|nr:HK97-gp10 family putative phage morphogenesis protein [Stenotrophomonas rhizophila]